MILRNPKSDELKIKQPIIPMLLVLGVLFFGTIGYKLLWVDYSPTWLDAFYMTFTTIATIGFKEVHPLNEYGQLFTILVATVGISSLFYIFAVVMENLFILQSNNYTGRRKTLKAINKLDNHIIIVGFGRVGKIVAEELNKSKADFVIIDNDIAKEHSTIEKHKWLAYEADATEDEALKFLQIDKAKAIIVATSNPTTTLFVVLTARELNKSINIIARADEDNVITKLKKAGANRIINPYSTGGQKLAGIALNPSIVDIVEATFNASNTKIKIESYKLENLKKESIRLIDLDIRKQTGATVIGIISKGSMELNPNADAIVRKFDEIIILGSYEQIEKFNNFFQNLDI